MREIYLSTNDLNNLVDVILDREKAEVVFTGIAEYMRNNLTPDYIFTDDQLITWAKANGFVKDEE
jgi:hypothetical protein